MQRSLTQGSNTVQLISEWGDKVAEDKSSVVSSLIRAKTLPYSYGSIPADAGSDSDDDFDFEPPVTPALIAMEIPKSSVPIKTKSEIEAETKTRIEQAKDLRYLGVLENAIEAALHPTWKMKLFGDSSVAWAVRLFEEASSQYALLQQEAKKSDSEAEECVKIICNHFLKMEDSLRKLKVDPVKNLKLANDLFDCIDFIETQLRGVRKAIEPE